MHGLKQIRISLAVFTLVVLPVLAGSGSGVGPSACHYAQYTCSSNDGTYVVCPSANSTLEVYSLKNGGSMHWIVPSKMVVPSEYPGEGDVEFRGDNLVLLISSQSTSTELRGQLTVFNAGLNRYPVVCQKND